jgi:hypothetical protein
MNMPTVNEYADFFDRYRALQEWPEPLDPATFKADFTRFKEGYLPLQKRAAVEARQLAYNFNIFRILNRAHYEVRTHSALLVHLLDPTAAHTQQHTFLLAFLAYCRRLFQAEQFPQSGISEAEWQVRAEFGTPYGYVDILIRSPELQFACVIENKIYAGEQAEQLKRYADWLQSQANEYPNQALIYLTPNGRESQTAGSAFYYRLSYRSDIVAILKEAITNSQSARVNETVTQYIQLIKTL